MSNTPVGDWIRKRYPPNPGATHYLGNDGDPGCCAGPHPACTYDAGFREGAAAERELAADAAVYAERERLRSTSAAKVAAEFLQEPRLGRADMTMDEACGQLGSAIASVRMLLQLLEEPSGA